MYLLLYLPVCLSPNLYVYCLLVSMVFGGTIKLTSSKWVSCAGINDYELVIPSLQLQLYTLNARINLFRHLLST